MLIMPLVIFLFSFSLTFLITHLNMLSVLFPYLKKKRFTPEEINSTFDKCLIWYTLLWDKEYIISVA